MPEPKFNNDPFGFGGHYTTQSAALASVLAGFGFAYRGHSPLQLVIDSHRVAAFVDKQIGEIRDCVRVAFHFDYLVNHELCGEVRASVVDSAWQLRELKRDENKGEFIAPSRRALHEKKLTRHPEHKLISALVNQSADAIENLCLLTVAVEELADDPLLRTTRKLRRGRLDFIRPLETEPVAQRTMERFNARNGDPFKQPIRR